MRPSKRPPALLVVLAALLLSGCGGDRDEGVTGAGATPYGTYAGEPALTPVEVARAYVQALDERDGERFCGLVAPYIAGRYDLAVRDPDSILRSLRDCPRFVSAFIGYVEDCCPPEFKAAKVEEVGDERRQGKLRSVDLVIRLHVVENGVPRFERMPDRVWLARLGGAWRVAKLSAVAQAASLSMPRFADEQEPVGVVDDPLARPDVAEEQRRFAAAVEDFRRRAAERRASYRELDQAADCSGGLVVEDGQADQEWNGGGPPGDPPRVPAGDIRRVSVKVEGEDVCVRWDLAGETEPPVAFSYGHRGGPTTGQFFDVELHEDGTARVTSGQDDDGRPIAVPAQVGMDAQSVTLRLDAESFRAGQREWSTPEPPPLETFGISSRSVALAGGGRSVLDTLGPGTSTTFRYPDGGICAVEGC